MVDLPPNWDRGNLIIYSLLEGEEATRDVLEAILSTFEFID